MPDTKIKRLLREPLLHFLLVGAALFLVYDISNEDDITDDTIIITKPQIEHLARLWHKKRLREPTDEEIEGLIEQQIREEVLVREALAMGLDIDDSIIRRRLAQKMEFITTDLSTLAEPTEEQLNDYLAAHSERFAVPAQIDFVQIYINPDKHGEATDRFAEGLLRKLSQDQLTPDEEERHLRSSGDTIMLDREYRQQTRHSISRWFGKKFADSVFALPVGSWQGPISSGYGLHLVYISDKQESRKQSLEDVREKVLSDWQSKQRREIDNKLYDKLRQRYEIIIAR